MSKLYSTSDVYYTQTHGARYSAPLLSKGNYPTLLELHSSMHSYLALANFSDGIGRLYGGVVLEGADSLRVEHRQQIEDLFAALCNHTCRTHELISTYLSFLIFQVKHSEEANGARESLARPYAELLRPAEAAFGDIHDPRFHRDLVPAIMACAIAALNLPFPDDVARFDYLPECTKFIIRHSPDTRRVRRIPHRLSAARHRGSNRKPVARE